MHFLRSSLLRPDQDTTLTLQLAARLQACSSLTKQVGKRKEDAFDDWDLSEISADEEFIKSAPLRGHARSTLRDDFHSLSSRLLKAHSKKKDSLRTDATDRSRAGSDASTLRVGSEGDVSRRGTEYSEYEDFGSVRSDVEFDSEEHSRSGSYFTRSSRAGSDLTRSSFDEADRTHTEALDAASDILKRHSSYGSKSSVDRFIATISKPLVSVQTEDDGHLGKGDGYLGKTVSSERALLAEEVKEFDPSFLSSIEGWLQKLIRRTSSTDGLSKSTSETVARNVVTVQLLKALERLGEGGIWVSGHIG